MSTPDPSPIADLLRILAKAVGEARPTDRVAPGGLFDPQIGELVHAFMVWEAGEVRAAEAMQRIHESLVDYNELRVCLPGETVSLIGEKYPRASERSARLRAALQEVYRREHAMSLSRAWAMQKREARSYLATLEGVHPFVASRVFLLGLGGHAAPVDSRILSVLVAHDVVEQGTDESSAASLLERSFRAGEAEAAYRQLEAASELPQPRPRRAKPSPKKPTRPKARKPRTSKPE